MAKNGFLMNAVALVGSNVISQIVAVLASIIEARLYSPLEMGVYSTYIAILAILTVVACLQYERAIILSKDEQEAKDLISLCVVIVLFCGAIILLVTATLSNYIASWLNVPQLAFWIKFLPFSLITAGMVLIMQYWNIKNSNLRLIALVNIITVMVMNLFQIGFGLKWFHLTGGMILGHLLGNIVAVLLYLRISSKVVFQKRRLNRKLIVRFKQFPLFSVPSTFIDTFGANLPNLLLTIFFGATITGYYALGYRLLSVPVSVISGAIGQAFLPKVAEAKQVDTLTESTITVFELILKTALVPLVMVSLAAKTLITTVFGNAWVPAVSYIPWLCFWLFLALLYSPLSGILIVLERQKDALKINVILFIVKIIALCLGGLFGSALFAVAFCSIASGIVSLSACFYILHLVKIDFSVAVKLIIKYVLRVLLFVLPMVVVVFLNENDVIQLVTCLLNGCLFLAISYRDLKSLVRERKV